MFDQLSAPFPTEKVSWRVGATSKDKSSGLALAYIDARDVMERLDEVCGPGGWQNDYPHATNKTICRIGIQIEGEWVWKANGAGDSQVEAEKGAASDAFKRAAVLWGIGRYLYSVGDTWVDLDQYKKIKRGQEGKLRAALEAVKVQPAPKQDNQQTKTLSEADSLTVVKMMKAAIGMAKTLDELERWSADPDTMMTKQSLQPIHFEKLKTEYMQRYGQLKQADQVAA